MLTLLLVRWSFAVAYVGDRICAGTIVLERGRSQSVPLYVNQVYLKAI